MPSPECSRQLVRLAGQAPSEPTMQPPPERPVERPATAAEPSSRAARGRSSSGRVARSRLGQLYLALVHALLLALIWQAQLLPRAARRLGLLEPLPRPELTPHYERMLRYHERALAQVPPGSILFVGDSLTQGLCVPAISPRGINYGIGGDTSLGVLQRLESYRPALDQAALVVLAIGVNDFRFRGDAELLRNYERILARLDPLPVLISSILPVDALLQSEVRDLASRIAGVNAQLARLAATRANTRFLDNTAALDTDGDGRLDARFHVGDGLHLGPAGNALWSARLRAEIDAQLTRAGD